jgi:thiol-disulfide isomerase/thioredoxin
MKGNPMKLTRLIVSAVLLASAGLAHALDIQPYSAAALAEAQAAGRPVALHFHADWCPTCRAQDRTLQALKAEKGLDLTLLTVDYDTEKDLKRRFHVNAQSTLVVLKGQKEEARLVGDSSADGLRAALKSAL